MRLLVTGSGGLVGSQAVRFFADKFDIIGVDNNYRERFFGPRASVVDNIRELQKIKNYEHLWADIRNLDSLPKDVDFVIHCASQPSHDYAASHVIEDWDINASATVGLLDYVRRTSPHAVFVFMSTNKVYGDNINYIKNRVPVDELFPIDRTMHSVYGASKLAADQMVQEFGRYYGMKTVCFRAGCISGPGHAGVEAHGFLSYLMKCAMEKRTYTIFGYEGKQVRDNIHSLDLVKAFWEFFKNPKEGEVYNMGGGIYSYSNILEAIELCEKITGRIMDIKINDIPRKGDHQWWITELKKFKTDFPEWKINFNVEDILKQIYDKHNIPARY